LNKDEALVDLCKALLQDCHVVEQPGWQKLILIGEVGDGVVGMRGYSYDLQCKCLLIAPGISLDPLQRLNQLMKADNASGRGWLKCMIRISRNGEVGADFEYNDADRWSHTPENYKDRIKEYASMPV
jgi:hypothetical protein